MQVILCDVEDNTDRERYCVNPTKCSCLCYNPSKNWRSIELVMAGETILCDDCTVHLGISRHVKEKLNIEEKITRN